MMYIHLHNLRFRSFHGMYEEERILGNDYELNMAVAVVPDPIPVKEISGTVNYANLLQLVKMRMAIPTPLLETIVTEMAMEIQSAYPEVLKISISLKKLYPPINNLEGSVGVSFEWNK